MMAGCITLKAAAANLAAMIQTFFEQSRCSGDKVVNLSSGLTEDDFVAFILIAIANFLHEENYEKASAMATITWVFQNYDYDYNYELRISLISRRSVCWQYCFFNLFSFTLSDSKGLYLQSPLFVLQRDLREIITSPFNLSHCSTSSLLLFLVKIRIATIAIFLENALGGHIWPSISSFPPSLVLLRWGKNLLHFLLPTRFFI